jgi:Calx-beta domain
MQVLGTAPPTDTLVVSVDGIPVRTFSEPMSSESAYSLRQIDLTPFANGGSRALQFAYNGPTTGVGSFFVDNVEMLHCPPPSPSISIEDVVVSEGNSGIRTATFMVKLSAATAQTVTVAYATGNGTATGGSDYISASGTLTFAPGTTTRPISVTINGDTLDEANETFFVNLSSPTNATLSDGQGAGASRMTIFHPRSPSTTSRSPRATRGRRTPPSPSPSPRRVANR